MLIQNSFLLTALGVLRLAKAAASIPVDIILATAGWKEESTFRRFYNKPVAVTNQMSLAVLDR